MTNYAIVIVATVALLGSTIGTNTNDVPSSLNARAADQTDINITPNLKRCGGCGGFGGWGW
ncbi:hypothetical protein H4S08_001135, partial [Coemansia sp. RSA 1365]